MLNTDGEITRIPEETFTQLNPDAIVLLTEDPDIIAQRRFERDRVEHKPDDIDRFQKAEIDAKGELVGIHKLSSVFYHKICAEYEKIVAEKPKLGYEYQLLWMSQHLSPVYVHNASDVKWYEIDDEEDLKYAEQFVVRYI